MVEESKGNTPDAAECSSLEEHHESPTERLGRIFSANQSLGHSKTLGRG